MDILDEKLAVTAFIAGLGVQSEDLMFSISKNPQARMAEVLAKTEKYINGEEALISKQRSSSTQKEKSKGDKKKRTKPQETGKQRQIPKEEQRKQKAVLEKTRECQGSQGTTSTWAAATVFTSAVHPSYSLSVIGPTRSAT